MGLQWSVSQWKLGLKVVRCILPPLLSVSVLPECQRMEWDTLPPPTLAFTLVGERMYITKGSYKGPWDDCSWACCSKAGDNFHCLKLIWKKWSKIARSIFMFKFKLFDNCKIDIITSHAIYAYDFTFLKQLGSKVNVVYILHLKPNTKKIRKRNAAGKMR